MAAVLGPRALIDNAIPSGVDAGEIFRFEMQEGMNAQEIIALAATTIGEANQYIFQRWGNMLYLTEMQYAFYRSGGASGMTPKAAEFSLPDSKRGQHQGHMLPLEDYDDAVSWSRRYLECAIREEILIDLEIIEEKWRNRCEFELLWRIFTRKENLIGQVGWDVGWVIGDNNENAPYVPPQRGSRVFDDTINHFYRVNAAMDAANALATIEKLAQWLSWQGHTGTKALMVSENDLGIYQAMDSDKFVRIVPGAINVVQGGNSPLMTQAGALEGIPGEVVGIVLTAYGQVELRYHERIPAGRMFMSKPYGGNNRGNGLAIRTERGKGFGMVVEPVRSRSLVPSLDMVLFSASHGVGVNDRTNGAVAQIAAGADDYEDPVPADFGADIVEE